MFSVDSFNVLNAVIFTTYYELIKLFFHVNREKGLG